MSAGRVKATTVADLLGTEGLVPVTVHLSWRASDPYAVELLFLAPDPDADDVSWLVARDLLAEGLSWPAGIGDVHVRPDPADCETTVLVLSHDGRAEFEFLTEELSEFLHVTYDHIPPGAEYTALDLDTQIAQLLEGETR